jgi:LysM repeat protein
VGQTLTIPATGTTQPPTSGGQGNPVVHVVQSGDTLWKIARKYGTTIDAIVKANNLDPNKYLAVGQKLIIQLV